MNGLATHFSIYHVYAILGGTWVTIKLGLTSIAIGSVLGFAIGMVRTSNRLWPVNLVLRAYVEFFRGTPLLVQLYLVYYGLPILYKMDVLPGLAATTAISLFTAAYMAEIVRGSIQSIDPGQFDAALSLGMDYLTMMRRIIMPQAVRIILPPAIGLYAQIIKSTSLASIIGFYELTRVGTAIRDQTYTTLQPLAAMLFIYFVICYSISKSASKLEQRLGRAYQ